MIRLICNLRHLEFLAERFVCIVCLYFIPLQKPFPKMLGKKAIFLWCGIFIHREKACIDKCRVNYSLWFNWLVYHAVLEAKSWGRQHSFSTAVCAAGVLGRQLLGARSGSPAGGAGGVLPEEDSRRHSRMKRCAVTFLVLKSGRGTSGFQEFKVCCPGANRQGGGRASTGISLNICFWTPTAPYNN